MSSKKTLIAYLEGKTTAGEVERLRLYRSGRTYYLSSFEREHVCHPSVTTVEAAKREAMLVFHVKVDSVTPC